MARGGVSVPTKVPEGGWGWVVCLASAWINGVIFGIINSFGVLYVVMIDLDGATAFKTSWIGSVCAGLTFFMAPFASVITDRFGCRPTAVVGSAVALAGILASNFATRIEHMYVTYGFTMGLGFAIVYQPSLYILGIYFQKRLGVANGLVCFGSAIFTMALPFVMRMLLSQHGLKACLWFQSSLVFVMLVGCLTFKTRPEVVQRLDLKDDYGPVDGRDPEEDDGEVSSDLQEGRGCCGTRTRSCCPSSVRNVIDFSIWKERNFRIWAIGVPIGVLGYFVPFFHLVKHVDDTLPEARSEVLIMCLGATSGVGRLVSGFLSDHPKINPVYIQQLSFLVIGVATTLMPVIRSFMGLCVLVLIMGLFDGAFVAMMGPIAFNFVGQKRASQAIGCILGLMSVPMMIGPPIAGIIYDVTGTYEIAFICAGVPPILCACILFLIRPEPRGDPDVDSRDDDSQDDKVGGAVMIARDATPAMEAKEGEMQSMLKGFGSEKGEDESKDDGNDDEEENEEEDGDGGYDGVIVVNIDPTRRKSYFKDRVDDSDARIIMTTDHTPHSSSLTGYHGYANGYANGYTNGDVNRYKNGVLPPSKYGPDGSINDGSQSPYAQRGINSSDSKHCNGNNNIHIANGSAKPNGFPKVQMNGFIHRSDAESHESNMTLIIVEKETAV